MDANEWNVAKNNIMHQMLDIDGTFGVKSPYTHEIWVYVDENTSIDEISSIMDHFNVKWYKYNDKRVKSTRRVKICVNVWHNHGELVPITIMSCGHGENALKKHETMWLCTKAKHYCMDLVNDDQIPLYGCEICTINWLCGDCDEYHVEPPFNTCKQAVITWNDTK